MKASKMTNEMLADSLYSTMPFLKMEARLFTDADEIMCEAAERLRLKQQSDNYASAMCRQEAEYKREICDLCRRLKIAEDALERIDNMCDGDMCKFLDDTHHCSACRYLNECQTGVAHAALNEIREKGGNNSNNEKAGRQPVTDCNRLGNVSKMREALIKAYYAMLKFIKTPYAECDEMAFALDGAIAALATPPRNCDRPDCETTKEAQDVWRQEDGGKTAYYEWLLSTSTKGEAK